MTLSASGRGPVQRYGGANESFESLLVNLVSLMDDYRAKGVAFEAGVEDAFRVLERSSLGEGQPHVVLVGLAGANDPVMGPYRNPGRVRWLPPFHLLDHRRVGLLDHGTEE